MSRWWIVVAPVAVAALILGIAALVVAQNDWEGRCKAAGGTIETRFDGFMTVIIGNPPIVHLQPQYSDHCWVAGREIDV